MFQAIQTKYHGPTNSKGSRLTATAAAGRVTVPYDHALDLDDNHRAAALAFCDKFGWQTGPDGADLIGGTLLDGSMVWVFGR